MSVWTHVAGIIRVDDIRLLNKDLPDFDKIIGKECTFESVAEVLDDYDKNPNDYMPCGDEGTLQKSIWINPCKESAAAYTISIFGDLRGYEAPRPIINWFKETCNKLEWIRQAVITVETEGMKPITCTYIEEELNDANWCEI